ncbi:MAG: tRNA (guanosine(46)-N7)-methyltransferase TrmB [Proteobacteria bacterium]|nr:tRNA (guanosine(46)-N7)-methyltransferase TrmB [Pseudomonadota bacterium]
MAAHQQETRRTIRSFVRRAGRLTPSQAQALQELWPVFGIDFSDELIDLDSVFGRAAPSVLEIGFGNGETLVEQAAANPSTDFIGIEVHEPGVGHCLLRAHAAGISNLRLSRHDAIDVLRHQIPDASLRRINLYFPDPWPKKRHHKRRILQHDFLQMLSRKIEPGGTFHIATDWQDYAEQIDELIGSDHSFRLSERRTHGGGDPLDRSTTKFERRGLQQGHKIWDWRLTRI